MTMAGDIYIGGLVGFGNGPLRIVNSFNMAGIRTAKGHPAASDRMFQNADNLEAYSELFPEVP